METPALLPQPSADLGGSEGGSSEPPKLSLFLFYVLLLLRKSRFMFSPSFVLLPLLLLSYH